MISYLFLVAFVAWALSSGLKRHEHGRRFAAWRVWLASLLGLSTCYFAANADAFGIPVSLLAPFLRDGFGVVACALGALAVFFCGQLIANHALLRDGRGAGLSATVNIRLCLRAALWLVSIPVALLAFHVATFALVFAL